MAGIMEEYNKIKNTLTLALKDIAANELAEAVTQSIIDGLDARVYDKYDPTMYNRRRELGGLADRENYVVTADELLSLDGLNSEIELEIKNITQGNDEYENADGYITDIVETGKGYNWKDSAIYKLEQSGSPLKRPFMEEGAEDAINSGKADYEIVQGLVSRGFSARIGG